MEINDELRELILVGRIGFGAQKRRQSIRECSRFAKAA